MTLRRVRYYSRNVVADRDSARALGVGLLSGGYGEAKLAAAGAYRVYDDPADVLLHLDEIGVRTTV